MASGEVSDSRRELLELAAERLAGGKGGGGSNYDYVKVKVRLGPALEHYYILSRFLLSRMLTVIALPQHKAVRIALDAKKQLVDAGRLEITQEELEGVVFGLLRARGYGDEYVARYRLVARFFAQKRPLIILIAGSACTGKSSLAQQLASRLNLPNVLQTDVLYELLRASGMGDLPAEPLWRRPLPAGASLAAEFQRECATLRRALDGDLCKCIRDGKSIIIEGMHLDPGLLLREFGGGSGGTANGGAAPGAAAAAAAPAPLMMPADSLDLGVPLEGDVAGSAGGAAGAGSGAVAEQLAALQLGQQEPAAGAAEGARAPAGAAGGTVPASSAAMQEPQQLVPQQQQQQQQQQQAESEVMALRRSASFGDAVAGGLSYGALRRQESPWRDAASSRAQLARPRSARPGAAALDRGQAVFMLRAPEAGSSDGESDSAPPMPSPRLATSISLPPVREDAPLPLFLPASAVDAGGTAALGTPASAFGSLHQPASGSQQQQQQQQQQQPVPDAASAAPTPAAPPPRGSVAAADAAAAVAAGTGPVFVPIVLAVPEDGYEGALADWLARQQAAAGGGGTAAAGDWGPQQAAEAARRLRALQDYLRQYAAAGVPVVELSPADTMGAALDSMHAYVLRCIALALGEEPAAAAPAPG